MSGWALNGFVGLSEAERPPALADSGGISRTAAQQARPVPAIICQGKPHPAAGPFEDSSATNLEVYTLKIYRRQPMTRPLTGLS